ncbi:MAG: twitching motility protein PilJ [Candidatus Azotimanducaceae bacterium]|jgi:twitching motility protein PilJ
MADRKNTIVGSTLKKPLISGLMLLAVVLVTGFMVNIFLSQQDASRAALYKEYTGNLAVLSQEIAKNANAASGGQLAIFPVLGENKASFDTNLAYLKDGHPAAGLPASPVSAKRILDSLSSLWGETKINLDVVLGNRDALVQLKDISSDLSITMSAIQQENNKVVAAMLRLNLPASQIALAQRQSLLIERMSRNVERVIEQGASDSLAGSFKRSSDSFTSVLKGLMDGNRELLLTAVNDTNVRASLTKTEELFRSVASRMSEILAKAEEVDRLQKSNLAIYQNSGELLSSVNRLAADYQENSGQGIASPLIGYASSILAFVVIFLLGVLIYREANRNVQVTEAQNAHNQEAILQLLDELADLADGDLRVQATVTESFTGAIADSINFSIDQLRSLVSKINEASGMVSIATEQTQSSLGKLSEASGRQAQEIADVSEAVNEMAVSIDMVSYNAAESSSVAERSVEIANTGASVVQNTIGGMDNIRGQIQETAKRIKRLGESSQEIGDIVSLINDIADQTNILSLNAAIQASMAGDAGKGFAVVADEVQRLAERSGAAAKQISALVKTIQSDTHEAVTSMEQTTAEVVQGTRLAQDAGVALGEIESVSKSLAEIIENISDAARQQAASAGTISNTMKSIEEITSQTSDGTNVTVVAVGNLANITNELRASVTGFKLPE